MSLNSCVFRANAEPNEGMSGHEKEEEQEDAYTETLITPPYM